MPNVDSNIVIGKNYIRYHDEVLKIPNISRTCIFRFSNRERKAHEERKRAYERAKGHYETTEILKIKERMKYYIGAMIMILIIFFFILISMLVYQIEVPVWIIFLICAAVICGYMAYRESKKSVCYNVLPPEERYYPDKYGLSIEMNSGYSVVFTAVGGEGIHSLRILQNKINDADTQQTITIFNMNDNRVNVENNEGIVSTGADADNKIGERVGRENEYEYKD